jgi:ATP-binding cassette subfamily B protein
MEQITIHGLIKEFLSQNKYMFALYLVFLAILPIRDIGIPHMFGKLVKSIEDKSSIITPLIWLFCITIIVNFGYTLIEYLEVELYPASVSFLRQRLMRYILENNDGNFSEVEVGKIVVRLMRFPTGLYNYLNQWKYIFIPNIILSIIATIYFSYYNLPLGLLLGLLLIGFWFMMFFSQHVCKEHSYNSETKLANVVEEIDDVLRNMQTVINTSQQKPELKNVENLDAQFRKHYKDALICSLKLRYILVPFNVCYFGYFIYKCYNLVKQKKMRLSTFVSLVIIMFSVFNGIWNISGSINEVTYRWGLIKSCMDIFNEFNAKKTKPNTDIMPLPKDKVKGIYFNHVSFIFPHRKNYTLKELDLYIAPNEKVVIVGTIGSGKSTILKLLLKLLQPTSGSIYLDGQLIQNIDPKLLRHKIGYIPQNPVLFNRSIYENITYGIEKVSREKLLGIIKEFGLQHMFSQFPEGLDTLVGKYGSRLSGGQKQIIWILHTIVQDPSIILMDEPTASVDIETKTAVYNLLSKMMKSRTVIMVTHDPFLLKYSDRIVTLKNGKISTDKTNNYQNQM